MRKVLLFAIIAMYAIVSSAKSNKDGEAWIEKSWKEKAKPLVLEEIDTKDLLEFAECCYVFDDILVVQTYNDTDIWLAYDGRMLSLMEILDNGGAITSSDSYIFRLDWDGKIRESYRLRKDKKIKSMSIGPDGQLYLACEVEGILKLFKAKP